jgi:L-alanine-DL-glutamate epimerase-like enolase superfamily enzyme
MKVASYRIQAARVPYDQAITGTHVILRLLTDEGVEGFSYVSRVGPTAVKPLIGVVEGYMEQVVGMDPLAIEAINARVFRRTGAIPGYEARASSLIDCALWDVKGRALGQPIWKLMGGFRDRVPAYASWGIEPPAAERNTEDVALTARKHVEAGFKAMKFHTSGVGPDGVVEHMRMLRDTVGPDIDIMVDVNQRWNVKTAIGAGRALEEYGLYWLEDPIPLDDYEGLRQVTDALETRICAGEVYRQIPLFRHLLVNRSVDVAMIDQDLGLSGFLKVAHMAEAHSIPVVCHLATEVLAHAVAAIPNGLTVEYYPWAIPLWQEPLSLDADGMLVLPDKPGLGLELDEAALDKYAVA